MISLKADKIFSFFTENTLTPEVLWPEEKLLTVNFSSRRMGYFSTGRFCAREAIRQILGEECPVGIESSGAPRWPPGIAGSISHTEGLTGAIVAAAEDYPSIGLDIEKRMAVDRSLWEMLFDETEQQRLNASSVPDELATLYFSMKEAYYKMQFPLTRTFLDFRDVRLEDGPNGLWINRLKPLPVAAPAHQAGYVFSGEFIVSWVLAEG
jgi:4'-phosphopantetheinyl transferase EntD